MSALNTNSDIELKNMKKHFAKQIEFGKMTKRTLLDGDLKILLKNAYIDRFLRSSFINSSG